MNMCHDVKIVTDSSLLGGRVHAQADSLGVGLCDSCGVSGRVPVEGEDEIEERVRFRRAGTDVEVTPKPETPKDGAGGRLRVSKSF